MPYKVKGQCIYKKDGGAKVGCTKGDVNKYLGALYANANESINEEEEPIDRIKQLINTSKKPDISFGGKDSSEGNKISIVGNSVEDAYELYDRLHKWLYDRKIAHKIGTRGRVEHPNPIQSKKLMTIYSPNGANFDRLLSIVGNMLNGYKGWEGVQGTPFNGYEKYADGMYFRNDRDEHGEYIPAKDAVNKSQNIEENVLVGGKADNLSIEDIANKFNVGVGEIQNQINKGIGIEMEHTNDKIKATEIATDHVSEIPDYYDRLQKMERDAYQQMGADAINSVDTVSSMSTTSSIYENTKSLIKRLIRENLF